MVEPRRRIFVNDVEGHYNGNGEETDQVLVMKRQSKSATPQKLRPDKVEATEEHRGTVTFGE